MAGEPITTLCGNVAKEPELRFISSGAAVCNFTLACTPRVKDGDTWTDGETMWVRCAVWRQQAENVAESIVKGTRVLVHGRLKVRSYDADGQKRTSIEMDVEHVGPELRYATAKVNKVVRGSERSDRSNQHTDDPWASAPAESAPF
jgi:single-strand DNA-binding protein